MNDMVTAPGKPRRQRATPVRTVVDRIDSLIAMGEFVPGQRLVESDMMARFSVSRTTVRAALQYLAGDGIVEILPDRGARIRRFEPDRLKDIMQVVVGGIIRTAMELFASRPLTGDVRAELEHRLQEVSLAAEMRHVVVLSDCMARYNEFICQNCGNAYVGEMLSKVHLRHYAKQFATQEDLADLVESAKGYIDITRHLLDGNAPAAIDILTHHSRRTIERFSRV